MLGIPFSFSVGKKGALYGIGAALLLSCGAVCLLSVRGFRGRSLSFLPPWQILLAAMVVSGFDWLFAGLALRVFLPVMMPGMAATGLTPELVFFECASCHHAMRSPRWNPGLGGSQEPGQLRLADASLVMSALILRTLDLPSAKSWDVALKQLHDSSRQSLPAIRASALRPEFRRASWKILSCVSAWRGACAAR